MIGSVAMMGCIICVVIGSLVEGSGYLAKERCLHSAVEPSTADPGSRDCEIC